MAVAADGSRVSKASGSQKSDTGFIAAKSFRPLATIKTKTLPVRSSVRGRVGPSHYVD